jgi:exodeoxyribonuclease VII small subunit
MNTDTTSSEASNEVELTFEDALLQLESIVGDLERGQTELSESLAKYQTGLRLLNHCRSLLDGAERNVAILEGVDEDGKAQTSPFDATATEKRQSS